MGREYHDDRPRRQRPYAKRRGIRLWLHSFFIDLSLIAMSVTGQPLVFEPAPHDGLTPPVPFFSYTPCSSYVTHSEATIRTGPGMALAISARAVLPVVRRQKIETADHLAPRVSSLMNSTLPLSFPLPDAFPIIVTSSIAPNIHGSLVAFFRICSQTLSSVSVSRPAVHRGLRRQSAPGSRYPDPEEQLVLRAPA